SRATAKTAQGTGQAAGGFPTTGGRKGVPAMRLKHEFAPLSVKTLGLSVAVVAGLMSSAAPAFADTVRLDYSVSHSKYGHIGSFSNTIDTEGQNTTVTTNENIAVKVIGITSCRQQDQGLEKWRGHKI